MKKIKTIVIIGVVFAMVFCSTFFSTTMASPEGTTVKVEQEMEVDHIGQVFNVTIMCYPIEPVKAYEFKLSYDPTVLQASVVTEGNIFNGFQTFYSPGIIDNNTGNIINIYGLILGQGNVTENGSISTIQFTCLRLVPTEINLYNVGITNSTDYLLINTVNATLSIYKRYDVNGDHQCSFQDVLLVAFCYGQKGAPGWIREDVDYNGVINLRDIIAISMHYGESW